MTYFKCGIKYRSVDSCKQKRLQFPRHHYFPLLLYTLFQTISTSRDFCFSPIVSVHRTMSSHQEKHAGKIRGSFTITSRHSRVRAAWRSPFVRELWPDRVHCCAGWKEVSCENLGRMLQAFPAVRTLQEGLLSFLFSSGGYICLLRPAGRASLNYRARNWERRFPNSPFPTVPYALETFVWSCPIFSNSSLYNSRISKIWTSRRSTKRLRNMCLPWISLMCESCYS